MPADKQELQKMVRNFSKILRGDSTAQTRVKFANTLLNSGHNLNILEDTDLEIVWESLFFAFWYAEMGRGFEEIIAAVERACSTNYRLTEMGFKIIARKWYGLDQYRVDKISHLARHLLPVLLQHQITLWLKSYNKYRHIYAGTDTCCRRLLKNTFKEVLSSYGLCYFMLEILAEEISKATTEIYDRLNITVGKFEFKANLIIFLYRQVIRFAAYANLDARLLRTFDQYVMKKFVEELLPNESQLTQILVSLRLHQALRQYSEGFPQGRCRALFTRWSGILQDIHENCMDAEYFPKSFVPIMETMHVRPYLPGN